MFSSSRIQNRSTIGADCLRAAQENDIETIDRYLNVCGADAVWNTVDEQNNTMLHYAAANGNVELFYFLLRFLKQKRPDLFVPDATQGMELVYPLSELFKNNKDKTPWHYAAQFGHADFFKKPDELNKAIWNDLKKPWLDFQDNEGNTPLHYAVFYDAESKIIKNKKHTVAALVKIPELNVNIQNNNKQTALHLVAVTGCYETGKELLKATERKVVEATELEQQENKPVKKAKNNKSEKKEEKKKEKQIKLETRKKTKHQFELVDRENKTAADYIIGHKRLDAAYVYYSNPKAMKVKSTGDSKVTKQRIIELSKDPIAYSADDFFNNFKLVNDAIPENNIKYEDLRNLMQLRYDELFKEKRNDFLLKAFASTLCPAFALSMSIGTTAGAVSALVGGLPGWAVVSSIVAVILLPFVYPPFVYSCYKSYIEEIKIEAEALYLRCAAFKLQSLQAKMIELAKKVKELEKEIKTSEMTPECLAAIKGQLHLLKEQQLELKNERASYFEPAAENKKPKLKLQFLKRKEFEEKKQLAINDPTATSRWVTKFETVRSTLAYKASILCFIDAMVGVGGIITTILLGKVGAAILGATAASYLGGPIVGAVVSACAFVALGVIVGYALYKASFVQEQNEVGDKNRTLILAHDAAKRSDNPETVHKPESKLQQVNDVVKRHEEELQQKEQLRQQEELNEKRELVELQQAVQLEKPESNARLIGEMPSPPSPMGSPSLQRNMKLFGKPIQVPVNDPIPRRPLNIFS